MKKVITIVSLSLVGILILTTIILSCITVGAKINFGDPSQLVIYSTDLGSPNKVNKDDKAEEVIKTFTRATNQKYLPALFEGTLKNVTVKTSETKSYFSRSNSDDNKVIFEFKYDEEQKITVKGEELSFYSLGFEVTESQERNIMKIFVITDNSSSSSVGYNTSIEVSGEFADLYLLIKGYINEYIA